MRCAVSSYGIIGPHFFENVEGRTGTVNAEYKAILETFLRIKLHPRQQDLLWFQQDGVTAQTAQISMQVLRTMFLGRLILGTSPGLPARLNLQYQTTSSGVTLKAGNTKHVLPILLT